MQLVINTFGATLRKEGDRFVITAGSKKLAISAHKVQSILIGTAAFLSTDARNVKQRDIFRHEAHALANALLGKCDLPIAWYSKVEYQKSRRVRQPVSGVRDSCSSYQRGGRRFEVTICDLKKRQLRPPLPALRL